MLVFMKAYVQFLFIYPGMTWEIQIYTNVVNMCLQIAKVPHDERPVPTLQSPAEQHSPLCDTQRSPNSLDMSGEPEPLSEMAQRQASLAVEVFGESLVRKKTQVKKFSNVF